MIVTTWCGSRTEITWREIYRWRMWIRGWIAHWFEQLKGNEL